VRHHDVDAVATVISSFVRRAVSRLLCVQPDEDCDPEVSCWTYHGCFLFALPKTFGVFLRLSLQENLTCDLYVVEQKTFVSCQGKVMKMTRLPYC